MGRSTTEKFVDGVYRRLVIFRIIEQFGLGILFASLLATVLNLLAIWQSLATLPILAFSACVGLFVGLGLTIYRWPTHLSAVTDADRQLQFDDLLTSAMFSASGHTDDFSNAVRAMADAKCRLHSPSDVLLRRLNARTWSAIGLAMSVAITLGVIPFGAARSQAVDVNSAVLSNSSAERAETSSGRISSQINDPISSEAWSGEMTSEPKTDAAASESKNSRSTGNGSSPGGGSITAEQNGNQKPQKIGAIGTAGLSGDTAGGGAASENQMQRGNNSNGQQGVMSTAKNQTPAWTGEAKTSELSKSLATPKYPTPPEDHDLIRDFFGEH